MKRTRRSPIPPEATHFAECARRYCELIGEHQKTPVRELLAVVHGLLVDLYRLGLSLPDIDSSDDPWRRDTGEALGPWTKVRDGLHHRLGHRARYMKVFDAYDRLARSTSVGLLDVDLADIYVDLADGLSLWGAGERADAIYRWRWSAKHHWGDHAIWAIGALHSLREHHDYGPPPPMPDEKRRDAPPRTTRARKR